jgi:hypothetical protein
MFKDPFFQNYQTLQILVQPPLKSSGSSMTAKMISTIKIKWIKKDLRQ